jgi:deoxycytidine triphosphate deaminase
MLSELDIKKELGKNIDLYPISANNIYSNSIDFTASKFAWFCPENPDEENLEKNICQTIDGNEVLVIPPHKTVVIMTKEAIHVTEKVGGSVHSKVSLTRYGLSSISTLLEPNYIGQLLITIRNNSYKEYHLNVGDKFVSVLFFYCRTPAINEPTPNSAGHSGLLADLDPDMRYERWTHNNEWVRVGSQLYTIMTNSDEFKNIKSDLKKHLEKFKGHPSTITVWVIVLIILVIVQLILYFISSDDVWHRVSLMLSGLIFPITIGIISIFINRNK